MTKYLTDGREIVNTIPYLSKPEINEDFVRGRDKYGQRVVFGTGKMLDSFGIHNTGTNASLYATKILTDLKPKPVERKIEKPSYIV